MKREGARPRAPVAIFQTERTNYFHGISTRSASLPTDRRDAIPPSETRLPITFHFSPFTAGSHGDDDLSDLLVRFHVAVRFDDLVEFKGFGDDRFENTGS